MLLAAFCTVTLICPWGGGWWQKRSPCENTGRATSGTMAPVPLTWMCCGILIPIRGTWLTSARNSRKTVNIPAYRKGRILRIVYEMKNMWGWKCLILRDGSNLSLT